MAADLKDHFMSKGQSVEDSTLLSDVKGDNFVPVLDSAISLEEIDSATSRLKEKSSGDGWTRKMLLNLPVCILYALQVIYNAVLSAHTYPTRWRTTTRYSRTKVTVTMQRTIAVYLWSYCCLRFMI